MHRSAHDLLCEPAVSLTNNTAENALLEALFIRKIIGTLRNDRGMFEHETLLCLLAAVASRDAIPTTNSSESLETTRRFHKLRPCPLLRFRGKYVRQDLETKFETTLSIYIVSIEANEER